LYRVLFTVGVHYFDIKLGTNYKTTGNVDVKYCECGTGRTRYYTVHFCVPTILNPYQHFGFQPVRKHAITMY